MDYHLLVATSGGWTTWEGRHSFMTLREAKKYVVDNLEKGVSYIIVKVQVQDIAV